MAAASNGALTTELIISLLAALWSASSGTSNLMHPVNIAYDEDETAGAGFAGYMTVLFLSIALWWGLANVMDSGWAALIVAVIWGVVAAVLYTTGRAKLRQVHPRPDPHGRDPQQRSRRPEGPARRYPVTSASDPDEIRREIERTQANLSFDVDALAEKGHPEQDRRAAGRPGAQRGGAMEGRGDGLEPDLRQRQLRRGAPRRRRRGAGGPAQRGGHGLRPGVLGGWDSCRSGVVSRHDGVRRRAGGPHAAQRQTQGNPLAAGLIAFGAGWLESSLLPATRREQQLAGQAKDVAQETAQAVAPTVRRAAEEVKENLRGPAEQAVESVRSTATYAGQTVADESKAAAAHVQDRAQDTAGTVRGHASSS